MRLIGVGRGCRSRGGNPEALKFRRRANKQLPGKVGFTIELSTLLLIGLCYFGIGILTASTGGTSLITVPLLIYLGISPRVAVATNMFGLVFHSLGGALGFRKIRRKISGWVVGLMILLTGVGSSLGAVTVVEIDENLLEKIIAVFIALIVCSFFLSDSLGIDELRNKRGIYGKIAGLFLVFILGIYGGFFSGGYVTILSYIFILVLGYNFVQAAYLSKILNICSSLVATLIFLQAGLIDLQLGVVVSGAFLAGSYLGARYASSKGNRWIRKLFIVMALLLLVKLIFF